MYIAPEFFAVYRAQRIKGYSPLMAQAIATETTYVADRLKKQRPTITWDDATPHKQWPHRGTICEDPQRPYSARVTIAVDTMDIGNCGAAFISRKNPKIDPIYRVKRNPRRVDRNEYEYIGVSSDTVGTVEELQRLGYSRGHAYETIRAYVINAARDLERFADNEWTYYAVEVVVNVGGIPIATETLYGIDLRSNVETRSISLEETERVTYDVYAEALAVAKEKIETLKSAWRTGNL